MMTEQPEFNTYKATNWRFVGQLAAVGFALALVVLIWRQVLRSGAGEPGMGRNHPAVGRKLQALKLQPLTGSDAPLHLDDLRGKVSLVNVWGTWCGPCIVEFPHLKDLAEHYHSRDDFRFVSISCPPPGADDQDLAQNTAAMLKEQRANFPTYADPNWETRMEIGRVAEEPEGIPYPTTVIVDRDGTVRALWFGYRDGLTAEMRSVLDAALGNSAGR